MAVSAVSTCSQDSWTQTVGNHQAVMYGQRLAELCPQTGLFL